MPFQIRGRFETATVYAPELEPEAQNQIFQFLNAHIAQGTRPAIMPDAHSGRGCVIGFTAVVNGKFVPNIIGKDIGCGVLSVVFKGDVPFDELDDFLRENVPHGLNVRTTGLHPAFGTVVREHDLAPTPSDLRQYFVDVARATG